MTPRPHDHINTPAAAAAPAQPAADDARPRPPAPRPPPPPAGQDGRASETGPVSDGRTSERMTGTWTQRQYLEHMQEWLRHLPVPAPPELPQASGGTRVYAMSEDEYNAIVSLQLQALAILQQDASHQPLALQPTAAPPASE